MKKNSLRQRRPILGDLLPQSENEVRILSERSDLYAEQEAQEHDDSLGDVNYVLFKMGNNQLYGVDYSDISQVVKMKQFTELSNVEPYVAGLIYWHGRLIPIISIGVFLNITDAYDVKSSYIVIMQKNNQIMGLLFDDIVGMKSYRQGQLQQNPNAMTMIKSSYVIGLEKGTICILNTMNIFQDISKILMGDKEAIK